MAHCDGKLIHELYEARARNDADAISSILGKNAVWHEPELEAELTGDLRGPDAVLAMPEEPGKLPTARFRCFRGR